jgi:amino acid adenylation domain-containing protein
MTTEPATALPPMTESQKGLLVVDSMVPTRQIYNQTMQFDFDPACCADGPLEDLAAQAIVTLVTVQPALRQAFEVMPEMRARLLDPPTVATLPLESITTSPEDYESTLAALGRRIGREPFDLTVGPVYRFGFVQASNRSAASILLCAHHIVGDGVSIGPIVRDLDAVLTGRLTDLDVLRVDRETALAKELRAQNRSVTQIEERAKAWAERLRDVPPLVLNPRPNRPSRTDFSGSRVAWTLDHSETEQLQATCKRLGVTPFVLLTAIYGTVLARHGRVSSVLIGSPFMARRTVGAFDLCGFFVNTLPVTVEVDWTRTVDEHVGTTVRAAVDFCRSNVDVPFNQLVAQAQPDRPSDRNPLFSCMLAMQDTFDGKSTGAIVGVREPGNSTAKFDLWMGATPTDGTWLLELEFDRGLIPPAVADGLLDSLRTALRRAVAAGNLALADLFDDAPGGHSLRNDGYPAEIGAPTLSEWFEATARRTPDAVAIEDPTGRLTYRQLAETTGRIAETLARQGVLPGDVVGLHLDNLSDTTAAILAILRRGATYLPLDASLPLERLAYMVDKAGCRTIMGKGLDLDGVRTIAIEEQTEGNTPAAASLDSPVYVMFTSGSTGRPKGVLMGHRPLLNLAAWQLTALGMTGESRFLQYAPAGFDVSYQEILPTLLAGGTVVSREPADRRDFSALLSRIADTRVTHVYLPVAALRPLVRCAHAKQLRLPAMRYLCVSGEQLLVDEEIQRFFADHPHCVLVNHYGPTETQAATTHRLSAGDSVWPHHVPIGVALPNVAAYLVDATGHLAPLGVPGELYLGGQSPADGYVNDPERTAERFMPDRFSAVPGATMYRTGDQAVRDEHGTLIFLGRDDTQLKVRGHRVELGEIETVANTLSGVDQAVAAARGAGADLELLLFLCAQRGAAIDHEQVRGRLAAALPAYMVPARIFDIDAVPTSSGGGKTDRAALVALADRLIAEQQDDAAGDAPDYANDVERELAELWAAVLNVPTIERDRPVMQYGAHSLNIFAALSQVLERFGVQIQLVDFFRLPTIATLAELIRNGAAQ